MAGGETSYFGFEYQIYVSVLVMLLHHERSDFAELEIETAFGNDATLRRLQSEETKTLDLTLHRQGLLEQIQVKTKSRRYAWQPNEFRDVLMKKDESQPIGSRRTLLEHLMEKQDDVFVFITNGVVTEPLSELLADIQTLHREIVGASFASTRERIIASVRNDDELRQYLEANLSNDLLQRIFIVDSLRLEDIQRRINQTLLQAYGIPADATSQRAQVLVDIVRDRMLHSEGRGGITAKELEGIVGKPGYRVPYPDLTDRFVTTDHFLQSAKRLDDQHIVILSGEPGVGKTAIARALVNAYAQKRYHTPLVGWDAHLAIVRACIDGSDTIFLLDDIFGAMDLEAQSAALGNQFFDIVGQLQRANGRVKVVITSRSNVLARAAQQTRMGQMDLRPFILNIPDPTVQLKREVLTVHLQRCSDELREAVVSQVDFLRFENLVHVRQFAEEIIRSASSNPNDIRNVLQRARPSAYESWIAQQSDANRLLLYVLWSVIKTNSFAWEQDLRRIYNLASACAKLSEPPGFGTWYDHTVAYLRDHQSRIYETPYKTFSFIHPLLQQAVETYLETKQIGFESFLSCLIERLVESDHPLDQSIAAMLCLKYRLRLENFATTLEHLSESPYVQTKEAIIRFGGARLLASSEGTAETQRRFLYRPYHCQVNASGHLVTAKAYEGVDAFEIFSSEMMSEQGLWYLGMSVEQELVERFERAVQIISISQLNPLERYRFGRWLYREATATPETALFSLLSQLATDPISFVRETVARFFLRKEVANSLQYQQILRNLCADNHPYVKIAMLEDAILPNWQFQSAEVQESWLAMVVDMLDDPFVRLHAATGLIDMSGTHYDYHAEHTHEQKKQWFIAIAPKLLAYQFEHWESFDRFLTKFDDYFPELPVPYRTQLLRSVAGYVNKSPESSEDTLYTIRRLVFSGNMNQEETDITIDLIRNLSPWGRTAICYAFARDYNDLPDTRFRDFVHRPFYNEAPSEYLAERAASILGFLSKISVQIDELPAPIRKHSDANIHAAIREYVSEQDDAFKKMIIFIAYKYERAYHIASASDSLYRDDLVCDLVRDFASSGTDDDATFIADVLLRAGYYRYEASDEPFENSAWLKLVELFLYNDRSDVCKRVCDIVFAANIASSVHNVRTFLMLVYRLLNHPNKEVEEYAFQVLDENFQQVWKLVLSTRLPNDWRKEIEQTWFSKEFLAKLSEKSSAFKIWQKIALAVFPHRDNWQELPAESKQFIVDLLAESAYTERPELVELVESFYDRIGKLLTEGQRKQIEEALYVEEPHRRDLRGRLQQLERDWNLDKLFPKVDWSVYFG